MSGARILKRLIAMKRDAHSRWSIEDVVFVCRGIGLICKPPVTGAHYVVWHPKIEGLLTIPARRTIRPFYIMLFVELAERALKIERLSLE